MSDSAKNNRLVVGLQKRRESEVDILNNRDNELIKNVKEALHDYIIRVANITDINEKTTSGIEMQALPEVVRSFCEVCALSDGIILDD